MTHPDTLQIPRAVVGQSITSWREQCSETTTLGAQLVLMQTEIDALRAALQQQAARCPLCNYNHGHAIGCDNNPVDIALKARAAAEPYAYCVYFPTEQRQEYCQDLDELCEDLTNLEHEITPLYTTPPATQAAITAALGALKTAQEALPPYGAIRRELDVAIAQIEALGVK